MEKQNGTLFEFRTTGRMILPHASLKRTICLAFNHEDGVQGFKEYGEGHIAKQCTKPKRKRDETWFNNKVLLVQAQASGQALIKKEIAFLADPGLPDIQTSQTVITHNAAYQADDLAAYDSDCDELNSPRLISGESLQEGSDARTRNSVENSNLLLNKGCLILSMFGNNKYPSDAYTNESKDRGIAIQTSTVLTFWDKLKIPYYKVSPVCCKAESGRRCLALTRCLGLSLPDVFPVQALVLIKVRIALHGDTKNSTVYWRDNFDIAVNPSLLVILHSVPELLNVDSRNTSRGRESSKEVGVTQDSEIKSIHLFLLVLEREHFVLPSYSA
ncbi:hypothetical protein Tco_1531621 [Tanacetum coccineum]